MHWMQIFTPVTAAIALISASIPAHCWEPARPIEIVVPASKDEPLDRMARVIQAVASNYNFVRLPIVVVNKPGMGGIRAFRDVRGTPGNPHRLILLSSGIAILPSSRAAAAWRDMTPVAMLARDEFVVWVKADSRFRSAEDYVAAIRSAADGRTGLGGQDRFLAQALEKAAGRSLNYRALRSGTEAMTELLAGEIDAAVSHPREAAAAWGAAEIRPLCLLGSERFPDAGEGARPAWSKIPTCRSAGLDVEYAVLRGLFLPPGVSDPTVSSYYQRLLDHVLATPEWGALMQKDILNKISPSGVAAFLR
jgi:putative tricarboxylic transport membrane protein